VERYFDYNATTPVCPEVLEVHFEALRELFGNASSIHYYGQTAKQRLELARRQVAGLIGCHSKEIVFVSGGTEANNLAIFGMARRHGRPHIVTSAIEHPAVLNPCAQLEREGAEVSYVPVTPSGVVDPDQIRRALRPNTVLVSIMHVNNEIGTVQPVAEIARIAHEAGALMHSDGVQAAGRIPVDVGSLGVDLYSASGHKIYAPKGVGVLYVRKGVELQSLLFGGRHESQRRAGTENVPGAIAMGAAAALAQQNVTAESQRLEQLRNRLEFGILQKVPDTTVNGAAAERTSNTTNICFEGIEGESMVIALDLKGFSASSGAACSSGAVEPSHVLLALGQSKLRARSSVRFSLGRFNTAEQVDELIEAVVGAAAHLRKLSPTYTTHA
jgi:cysteine desulfurase